MVITTLSLQKRKPAFSEISICLLIRAIEILVLLELLYSNIVLYSNAITLCVRLVCFFSVMFCLFNYFFESSKNLESVYSYCVKQHGNPEVQNQLGKNILR